MNVLGRVRPHDVVLAMKDLVSPPPVYSRLLAVLDRRDWTVADLADVIERDAGVAARTLRLANSPYYGMHRRVGSVGDAVAVLGTAELQNLVLATSVMESFTGIPPTLLSLEDHWRRSVRVSCAAACLAKQARPAVNPKDLLIAGLLHDVGTLVVCLVLPEQAREAMLMLPPQTPGRPVSLECAVTAEQGALIGGELLSRWSLPSALCDAVTWHTAPAERHDAWAALVHIAWRFAHAMEHGVRQADQAIAPEEPVWRLAGLRATDLLDLPEAVDADYRGAMAMFGLA